MLIPFSPKPGLNSDDTTFASEGRWTDGNNVRFHNGKPQVRGGVTPLFSISDGNGLCRSLLPFCRGGNLTTAYGLTQSINGASGTAKLYVGTGLSAPADRTPAGLAGMEPNWSLAAWGETLLAVPEGGTLYEQSGASAAIAVANAPDEITYMLVTAERQVLALGCNEEVSGDFNALCIRGCDLENYTDWSTTPENNAFEHILAGSGGIVAARIVGQYVAVWTDSALFLGQFMGDPGQTYRFDPVAQNCGLAGPNAVVAINGTAYWLGPNLAIHAWAPGGPVQTLPSPVSIAFRADVDFSYLRYAVASHNTKFNELRFDYCGNSASAYPTGVKINRYVAVCLTDGSWHFGNHGMSSVTDSQQFVTATANIGGSSLVSADENGDYWVMEKSTLTVSSSGLQPYLQSADQYIDNGQRRMLIRGCLPDFESQAEDVELTLYVRDRPQSEPTQKGPYTLTPGLAKKDFRASGKIISVKWSGAATGSTHFRLGKPLFDVMPLGER